MEFHNELAKILGVSDLGSTSGVATLPGLTEPGLTHRPRPATTRGVSPSEPSPAEEQRLRDLAEKARMNLDEISRRGTGLGAPCYGNQKPPAPTPERPLTSTTYIG